MMPESRYPRIELPAPHLATELQAFCLSFEGAWEDYPWGDVVYKIGNKLFALLFVDGSHAIVTVKAAREDADALCQLPHIRPAPYIGRHGWVSVCIEDEGGLGQAFDLIDASYQLVRGKRRGA